LAVNGRAGGGEEAEQQCTGAGTQTREIHW
jgi:hypothetical protein